MTPAEIIKKRIEIRDYMDRKAKEREVEDAPYVKAADLLEGMMQQHLNQDGADNIKTEHGTAYKTTLTSVRMADRAAFIDFVRHMPDGYEYFTSAVSKEKIKEYQESSGGSAPPGIDLTYITKVNFRRS